MGSLNSSDPNRVHVELVSRRASTNAVREFDNKSAASAASPDYVNFQAVIKSAASAASLRGGRASGRLDHGFFLQFLAALAAKKSSKSGTLSDELKREAGPIDNCDRSKAASGRCIVFHKILVCAILRLASAGSIPKMYFNPA